MKPANDRRAVLLRARQARQHKWRAAQHFDDVASFHFRPHPDKPYLLKPGHWKGRQRTRCAAFRYGWGGRIARCGCVRPARRVQPIAAGRGIARSAARRLAIREFQRRQWPRRSRQKGRPWKEVSLPSAYVRHRPVTRGRVGSATELNAGSQPTGTDTGNGDVSLDFVLAGLTGRAGFTGRRSPLSMRLTSIDRRDAAVFGAVAAQTTEAIVQLRKTAATTCFRLQPKISDMARALRPPRPEGNYSALRG